MLKNKKEIKLGILFVGVIVILVWGISFLKGKDFLSTDKAYYVLYDQVNGLVEVNPVMYKGIKIGKVEKIFFNPDTSQHNIVVKLSIHEEILITKESIARIVSADLMGSKAIELVMAPGQQIALDGDTLRSDIQASLQEEVNIQLAPLKRKTENLISSVDTLLAALQAVLNKNTQENLRNSFESIKNAIANLENTSYQLDTIVTTQRSRLSRILANVESISHNLKNNNEGITNVISNFSAISDSLAKANVAQTLIAAEKTLTATATIMDKINKGQGSVGLLVNNDSLYHNLESSSRDLDALLKDIKENPKRYIHFSVFGRKK